MKKCLSILYLRCVFSDSGGVSAPNTSLSILYLRCTIYVGGVYNATWGVLSILYLRCSSITISNEKPSAFYPFNSLFEMHGLPAMCFSFQATA